MPLEHLNAQRDALKSARYAGVVKAGDKLVTYRSDKELQAALADIVNLRDSQFVFPSGKRLPARGLVHARNECDPARSARKSLLRGFGRTREQENPGRVCSHAQVPDWTLDLFQRLHAL